MSRGPWSIVVRRLLLAVVSVWLAAPASAGDLADTHVLNMREILAELDLVDHPDRDVQVKKRRRFETFDPYYPAAKELVWEGSARRDVLEWYADYDEDESVCALKFVDADERDYVLATFDSAEAARKAGYVVTHHHHCGACSTLKDLKVYLDTPDLTTPARACAMKLIGARSRKCFIDKVGFTPWCAEAWAANARHTRKKCKRICMKEYGFFNTLRGNFSKSTNNTEDGALSPCLQCDETSSGAGFKYAAGRTRRNSGIQSAIERTAGETQAVDHTKYFSAKPPDESAD